MSIGRVFILASIGDPKMWRSVLYNIDDGCCVESSWSTAALLVKAFIERPFRKIHVLSIAADTLLASGGYFKPHEVMSLHMWRVIREKVESKVINDLLEKVRRAKLKCSPTKHDLSLETVENLAKAVEVAVCPGIGEYPVQGERGGLIKLLFNGSLQAYYICFLINSLAFIIKNQGGVKDGEGIEIWLDMSHGVNYMPSTAMVAIQNLMRALHFYGLSPEVRLFNSDPIPYHSGELEFFRPHMNELSLSSELCPTGITALTTKDQRNKVLDLFKNPGKLFSKDSRSRFNTSKRIRQLLPSIGSENLVYELWCAIAYGYPLLLLSKALSYRGNILSFKDFVLRLREALYSILDIVEVVKKNERIAVETSKAFNNELLGIYPTFIELYALFDKVLDTLTTKVEGGEAEEGYTLKQLKDNKVLLQYSFPHVEHFIGREIKEIECTVVECIDKGKDLSNWRLWRELRDECGSVRLRCDEDERIELLSELIRIRYGSEVLAEVSKKLEDRDFIAHLGLTYDLVELKLVGERKRRL
ncbi:MAG: TM1812 family CRISPR-associated protein [Candidatus Nezhaarchaeales archaeon]